MLPRQRRLTQEKDFKIIYRRGRREQTPSFSFLYLPTNRYAVTKIGVVVSSKVDKRATKRNLYKRRLGAALRGLGRQIPPQGYLILLITKPTISAFSYVQLVKQLELVVGRIFSHHK